MTNRSYAYAASGWWRGGTRSGAFRLAVGDGKARELSNGLPADTLVQTVTVHSEDSENVYIGTQDGPYLSTDHGDR